MENIRVRKNTLATNFENQCAHYKRAKTGKGWERCQKEEYHPMPHVTASGQRWVSSPDKSGFTCTAERLLREFVDKINQEPKAVWAVINSSYYPREVDSIWATKELGEVRANQLGKDWRVTEWEVGRA
jgi:hypothetical protein